MSLNNVTGYQQQEKAYFEGKLVTVVSTSQNGSVVIVDENGNRHSVNPANLKRYSIYNFYQRPEVQETKAKIAELTAKAKEYDAQQNALRKEKSGVVAWIGNFFRENNVVSGSQLTGENRELFAQKDNKKWDLTFDATKLGNQAFSLYNQACSLAHDLAMWG